MKKRKCNLWAMLMVVMLCFSELGSLAVKASDDEQNDESSVMQTSSEEGSESPVPVGAAPAPDTGASSSSHPDLPPPCSPGRGRVP